jgi:hypothetical protein
MNNLLGYPHGRDGCVDGVHRGYERRSRRRAPTLVRSHGAQPRRTVAFLATMPLTQP